MNLRLQLPKKRKALSSPGLKFWSVLALSFGLGFAPLAVPQTQGSAAESLRCLFAGFQERTRLPAAIAQKYAAEARSYAENRFQAFRTKKKQEAAKILQGSKNKPVVYDVLLIGGGPHSSMLAATLHSLSPHARIGVVDASDDPGAFRQVAGFQVNTQEGEASGNTFVGSPVQVDDFNFAGAAHVPAETFGYMTTLALEQSNADVFFKTRVTSVRAEDSESSLVASIKLGDGNTIYAHYVVAATGLGKPVARIADSASKELITRVMADFRKTQTTSRSRLVPRIQFVDDLLGSEYRWVYPQASGSRAKPGKAMSRYPKGSTFAVIGAGDGGAIAVEGILGLNETLNPDQSKNSFQVHWLGQKAKNGDEYFNSLPNENRKIRYGKARKGYDSGQLHGGAKAVKIEEIKENGRLRYRLTLESAPGEVPEVLVVDYIVFATGYENVAPGLFVDSDGTAPSDWRPLSSSVAGFTRYSELESGVYPVAQQFYSNGTAKPFFIVGNAAEMRESPDYAPSDAEWNTAVGGYLDIFGARTAGLAGYLGQKISGHSSKLTNAPILVKSGQSSQKEVKLIAAGAIPKYSLPIAVIAAKAEFGSAFSGIYVADSTGGKAVLRLRLEFKEGDAVAATGIDMNAAALNSVTWKLKQSVGLIRALFSVRDAGAKSVEFSVPVRPNGSLRLEDLDLRITEFAD